MAQKVTHRPHVSDPTGPLLDYLSVSKTTTSETSMRAVLGTEFPAVAVSQKFASEIDVAEVRFFLL